MYCEASVEVGKADEAGAQRGVGALFKPLQRANGRTAQAADAIQADPSRTAGTAEAVMDWQTVDRALRSIAARAGALAAEEMRWLREAEALQIWKPLGMVSAIDYMERVLGYAPRTAQDRLRVARTLAALPKLDDALAHGALHFTAVRELTRVATPANEADWRDAALGKTQRQVEELVADHRPGDGPQDPKDPAARIHRVQLELSATIFARLRQTRQALDEERGGRLSDDDLVAMLCEAALERASAGGDADDGRAKFQVAVTVCERCRQGWQEGAGVTVPISAGSVERALCDAQHIGSLDGSAPERAHQDITPSIARFVRRRDGGRCRVPGCRSARALELHHILHREHGGHHGASNLILLCSSCHTAHHDGLLKISGTAAQLEVSRPEPAPTKLAQAVARARSAHVGARETGPSTREPHHTGSQAAAYVGAKEGADSGAEQAARSGAKEGAHVGAKEDAHVGAKEGADSGAEQAARSGAKEGAPVGAKEGAPVGAKEGAPVGAKEGADSGAEQAARSGAKESAHPGAEQAAYSGAKEGADPSAEQAAHVAHAAHSGAKEGAYSGAKEGAYSGAKEGAHPNAKEATHVGAEQGVHPGAEQAAHVGAAGAAYVGAEGAARVRAVEVAHVGASEADQEGVRRQAKQALVALGWSSPIATAAVSAAAAKLWDAAGPRAKLDEDAALERLIFEALRSCPRPRAST